MFCPYFGCNFGNTTNINVYGNNNNINFRQFRALPAKEHPHVLSLKINNNSPKPVDFQLQTPGGEFTFISQSVNVGQTEAHTLWNNVYDIAIRTGDEFKTVKGVVVSSDLVIDASAVLSGNFEGIPVDKDAKPVSKDALVKDYFSGDALEGFVKATGVAADGKFEVALAKALVPEREESEE